MSDQTFAEKATSSQARRQKEIADVEAFVIDRCDGPATLRLISLQRLSDKDLAWLSQAVNNA
jgi:hypothetical protein